MHILLTSIGTRGDMEPFLAIGELLQARGHSVTCLFPEQFRNLAEDSGFAFESLGPDFINMLNSEAGQTAMGGGPFGWKKFMAYLRLIKIQQPVNRNMVLKQEAVVTKLNPDRIVHNGKAIYPVVWAHQNPGKTVLISPVPYMHYVKGHAHIAFNRDMGAFLNKMSYKLANFGLIKTISGSVKHLSGSVKLSTSQIRDALFSNKVVYTISPTLFERPDYWPENRQILGFHERSKTENWEPSDALEAFLKKHDKTVLVTFGSMVNTDPPQKTRVILKVLERLNIPAIINTASGGLVKPEIHNTEQFLFVERIPYDWVFPKLHAVIHHGGSGTTHTAIKYGCASLIIPHIIDQYVWNKMIHAKGLGPLGTDVSKITVKNLEPKVQDLMENPLYHETAQTASAKMQSEDLRDTLLRFLSKS